MKMTRPPLYSETRTEKREFGIRVSNSEPLHFASHSPVQLWTCTFPGRVSPKILTCHSVILHVRGCFFCYRHNTLELPTWETGDNYPSKDSQGKGVTVNQKCSKIPVGVLSLISTRSHSLSFSLSLFLVQRENSAAFPFIEKSPMLISSSLRPRPSIRCCNV